MPGAGQVSSPPPILAWSALGAVYVIWGSTYLAIRVMVETIPPFVGASVRFLLAGALLLGVLALRGRRVRPDRGLLLFAAVTGTLLPAAGNGLVTVAEQDVPSGLAALLVATMPLFIVAYGALAGRRPHPLTIAGTALGFVGTGVLLLGGGRPDDVPLGMSLLVVVAAAAWGFGSFLISRGWKPGDLLVATGWQMVAGGAVLAVAAVASGEVADLRPATFATDGLLAFGWLVLGGSIAAFSAYAYALEHLPISTVSTYAYVNPVIAVALGAVLLDEEIAVATVAGMVLVVLSVAVVISVAHRYSAAHERRDADDRVAGPEGAGAGRGHPVRPGLHAGDAVGRAPAAAHHGDAGLR